jgi:hypothetical protein
MPGKLILLKNFKKVNADVEAKSSEICGELTLLRAQGEPDSG